MRKLLLLLFSALFVLSAQAEDVLRLMTYNVRNANGMDGICNYQRVANVINNARPDIVAIQELDSMTARSNRTDVLKELAERTQLHPCFAPAIDYDGGKYGIGILSKETPLRVQTFALPGREEARTLLVAEFPEYVFACTHLSLTEEDRMKSLEILIALKQETPTFVVNSARVIDEPLASDHRPLLVEVRMAVPENRICRTKPYLQNPVGGGITVMWQTNVPAYCWVEYGTDPSNLKRARTLLDGQVVCGNTLHKIRLDSLQPGQKYYYRTCSQEILLYQAYKKVFGNTARTELREFTLPAAGDDSFTAVVFNDLHKQSRTFQALCEQIKGIDYDFVVFNGDCVDDPANHDQATAFISELTEGVEGDRVPVFFMRGNHEIRNAYSVGLHSLFDYVGDKTYGSFNWGDTRIVMLDCGEDKPDDHWVYYGLNDFTKLRNDQVGFLKRELASKEFKKAAKRILIHHIPLYGNDYENLCSGLWGKLLEKAPFNISLNAHTHEYAYHPKGSLGNNFPVIIGGGYSMKSATVMVIEKKKDILKVKVLNTKGEVLLELTV